MVYGKRATPDELLAGFAERASETFSTTTCCHGWSVRRPKGSVPSVLPCGWPWARSSGPRRPGPTARRLCPSSLETVPIRTSGVPDPQRAFPVRHGGELLGAISVVTPLTEPLGPDRERLVSVVAAQTGLVLRNARLIEDLRQSRRRIVATQDLRAKALERNIDYGAQEHWWR